MANGILHSLPCIGEEPAFTTDYVALSEEAPWTTWMVSNEAETGNRRSHGFDPDSLDPCQRLAVARDPSGADSLG